MITKWTIALRGRYLHEQRVEDQCAVHRPRAVETHGYAYVYAMITSASWLLSRLLHAHAVLQQHTGCHLPHAHAMAITCTWQR
jgi:hypothetical protein